MLAVIRDFRDEVDEFHCFLGSLSTDDWDRETGFMEWTPWDVIAHLHFFDQVSLLSLEGEEAFAAERVALFDAIASGRTMRELARERLSELSSGLLLSAWRDTAHALAAGFGAADAKQRLPWFGPEMGLQMFATARYMETWAHAQEIYDLVGAEREHTDRIQNIATIGVKTFAWTFINRRLEVPGPPPYVRLVAPSGELWEWNDRSEIECVRGSAVDFCHVVTQGRNILDTPMEVSGPIATRWMAIAQCFAGGAVDPPEPGVRVRRSS